MKYTHAQQQLWDVETLDKYPLLGKTYETNDLRARVTVLSYDAARKQYRSRWSDTHGWSLIPADSLLDPTVWHEVI